MSQKQTYLSRMQAKLNVLNAAIRSFKAIARSGQANVTNNIEYYNQLEGLRVKQHTVRTLIRAIDNRDDATWQDLKPAANIAWKDLKHTLELINLRCRAS